MVEIEMAAVVIIINLVISITFGKGIYPYYCGSSVPC